MKKFLTFEALGNDQNYREVSRDQNGVTDFQFRYSLQAKAGEYDGPAAMVFSRSAATPLLAARGRVETSRDRQPSIAVDVSRAIATCCKPAEDAGQGGIVLRLREIAGRSGPVSLQVAGYRSAMRTDLLERDLEPLPITRGGVTVELKANGYGGLRLLP